MMKKLLSCSQEISTTQQRLFDFPFPPEKIMELIALLGSRILIQEGHPSDGPNKANFLIDSFNQGSLLALAEFISRQTAPTGPQKGILIRGPIGTGKTFLAKILKALLFYRRKVLRIVPAVKMAEYYISENLQEIQKMEKGILCIDDLGTEPVKVNSFGSIRYPAFELLCRRSLYRRPTFITTNLSLATIEKRYGNRFLDRLREMMTQIILNGPSRRTP